MANYQFTLRNARGDGAGAFAATFSNDDHALRHARDLLAYYAAVEVTLGVTRLALLRAPTDFGRRPRFTSPATTAPRGIAAWFNRRGEK